MALILKVACETSSENVFCEDVTYETSWIYGILRTCMLKRSTSLLLPGLSISSPKNERILGMEFYNNSKVFHLPIEIYKNFPDLEGLSAGCCSIKSITKRSFMKLTKLKEIWLEGNKIEIIPSDTFEDLILLKYLRLRE